MHGVMLNMRSTTIHNPTHLSYMKMQKWNTEGKKPLTMSLINILSHYYDYCDTHIGNNRQNGHCIEDFLPCSDVSGFGCHRSSELGGELPGVHPDLQDVVEQSQKGSQGEGGHKQSDETKLDH